MTQKHQGEKSTRRPDVVIVSRTGAKKVRKQSGKAYKDEEALKKPAKQFQWIDVRSTVEFKHQKTRTGLSKPPATYAVKAYDVPEAKKYMKYRRETNATAKPTSSTPLADSGAATSSRQTSDARGRSKQSRAPNKKKRGSSQALDGHSSKKSKVGDDEEKPPKEKPPKEEPQKIHPVLQNGLYAAELFAAHIVRQSVITYVVEDDMIYLWYFDRQDAIQCSGINYVQDLPRFMVLLLAIQRMPFAEWGYNRVFEPESESSGEVRLPDEHIGEVDLAFDLKSDKRTTHFGLRGRATTVFPVKSRTLSALVPTLPHHNPHNTTNELVAKLYWPEEERESEVEILKKVYEIAMKDEEGKVKHHVPEMVWSHKFEDTSTANIRKALGLKDAERGRRVLYIIVFRKLDPITDLSDKQFLAAWWHIVVCHYALWGKKVHHRDVSPSNLMVYKTEDGRYIGVLNDFDLSSTQDGPSGQERTGTVPFMAIELLTKEAIEGHVKHLYQHDAESFIWVLTWVCLRYGDGQLLWKGGPLDDWLKVTAIQCRKEKTDFLYSGRDDIKPSPSHLKNWDVAQFCLDTLGSHYAVRPSTRPLLEDRIVFESWLENQVHGSKRLSQELLDVRV
jgi:serine/threonine protein kinase